MVARMSSIRTQIIAGLAIVAIGISAMAGLIPALSDYTYSITWWGLLMVVDACIYARRGLSLWRRKPRHFLLITLPLSVIFWLVFECFNLLSPQWHYRGGISTVAMQVVFGFVSFATVIPIEVEAYWAISGAICIPHSITSFVHRRRLAIVALGIIVCAIPFFNRNFWFNQGMWLAPAMFLLPVVQPRNCADVKRFWFTVAAAGLASGFVWECLNYWSRTHWEYLILPGAPHLFQMPLPGYLGFIPFAFTAVVVYDGQLHIAPTARNGVLFWMLAFLGLWLLTVIYDQRSLWTV